MGDALTNWMILCQCIHPDSKMNSMLKLFLLATLALCSQARQENVLDSLLKDQVLSVDDLVLLQSARRHLSAVNIACQGLNATIVYGQHRAQLEQFIQHGKELEQTATQYFDAEKNGANAAKLDELRRELAKIERSIETSFDNLKKDDLVVRYFVDLNIRELIESFENEIANMQSVNVVLPKQVGVWVQALKDKERTINLNMTQTEFNQTFEQIQTIVQDIIGSIKTKIPFFNVYQKYIQGALLLATEETEILSWKSQWNVKDVQSYATYLQNQMDSLHDLAVQMTTLKYYYATEFIDAQLAQAAEALETFQDQVR